MIKKIATYIIGTAGVVGACFGLFKAVDMITDNQADMMESIEYINVEQQFMSEDIDNIQDTQDDFAAEYKEQGEDIKTLYWAIRNQDNFTPQQLREIIDEMLNHSPVVALSPDTVPADFIPIN